MNDLFVIMVTYQRLDHFKRTLNSLFHSCPRSTRIVIIDNHSTEPGYCEYFQELKSTAPGAVSLSILSLEKNLGWGAAMNEGLKVFPEWKNYKYLLESNNDVEYEPDWFDRAREYMEGHPMIGILGLWKHPHHGVRSELGDGLVIKDDMPATAWFFRTRDLVDFLPFPEKGPTKKRGGNGEDVDFRDKVQNHYMRWICGTKHDLAHHMDGYDTEQLGQENQAYS